MGSTSAFTNTDVAFLSAAASPREYPFYEVEALVEFLVAAPKGTLK